MDLYSNTNASNAAASDDAVLAIVLPLALLAIAAIVLTLAAMWRVFVKAKQPGWAVLIPFYDIYVLLKVAGRPGWWLVLYFIPLVNFIISLVVFYDIAKAFGKDVGYMLLLTFIPVIGWPLLAWGDATYKRPKHA